MITSWLEWIKNDQEDVKVLGDVFEYTNSMFIIHQHVYSDTSHKNTCLSWVSYLFALIPISATTSTLRLTDLRY